jgi:putative transcriptional regulator
MGRTLASIRASRPAIDRAKVAATTEAGIRLHAVEDGEDPAAELGAPRLVVPPAALRARLGLSQAELAAALGIPLATLAEWESGRVQPDAGSRSLLAATWRDPETVFRLIAGYDAADA